MILFDSVNTRKPAERAELGELAPHLGQRNTASTFDLRLSQSISLRCIPSSLHWELEEASMLSQLKHLTCHVRQRFWLAGCLGEGCAEPWLCWKASAPSLPQHHRQPRAPRQHGAPDPRASSSGRVAMALSPRPPGQWGVGGPAPPQSWLRLMGLSQLCSVLAVALSRCLHISPARAR